MGARGGRSGRHLRQALRLRPGHEDRLGSFGRRIGSTRIAALVVLNPVGDVIDPADGSIVAGVRSADGLRIEGVDRAMAAGDMAPPAFTNTVLSVVATDAPLTKVQATRLARMASAGLARTIRPAHTMHDGDVVFALSVGGGCPWMKPCSARPAADVLPLPSWRRPAPPWTARLSGLADSSHQDHQHRIVFGDARDMSEFAGRSSTWSSPPRPTGSSRLRGRDRSLRRLL
jgi:hypothetical protein